MRADSRAGLEPLRLLLVEDNATLSGSLCKRLAAWGMSVDAAADGAEALNLLRTRAAAGAQYDAAIIDLHGPTANGIQLMRAIKDDPAIGPTWLIAASSSAAEALNRPEHSAPADMWLARPIRPSQLLQSLKELPAQRHRNRTRTGG